MVSIDKIGAMVKAGDVNGLFDIFNRAGDWDTRETVTVALRAMVWDEQDFDRDEMRAALTKVRDLCKAESGGGSYRRACLSIAEDLLGKLGTT